MNWSQLRGHSTQVEMLRRSLSRGRLAHAYLFAGPPGIGRSRFARIFAQCLLCQHYQDTDVHACGECSACRQMEAGSHPDFFWIGCPEGKNEISIDAFLGDPEKRPRDGLIYDLSMRPMVSRRRVAVIDDADMMKVEAANSMLKTLEEPPPHSVMILVPQNLDAMLPTIRSRCQLIRFAALPTSDVAELLLEQEIASTPEEAQAAAAMSDGSLQLATQLLNPGLRTLREQLYQCLSSADMNSVGSAKAIIEGVEGLGSESPVQRRNFSWLVRFAQEFYRQALLEVANPGAGGPSLTLDVRSFAERQRKQGVAGTELIMELFDRAVEAEVHLASNVGTARAIEVLLDDIGRISRKRRKLAHA